MSILNAANRIEQRLSKRKLDTVVKFFDSHEAYQAAAAKGEIHRNDVCFINDVPDEDLDEAISCLENGKPIPESIRQKIEHEMSVFNNPAAKGRFSYLSDEELRKQLEKYEDGSFQ